MKIRRINDNTISCIISPEDLKEHGIRIDDFFERKKEAVDFIRATVAKAILSENFDLTGEMATMRISVLPDHSLSLLISREDPSQKGLSEARKYVKDLLESISEKAKERAGKKPDFENDPIAGLLSDTSDSPDPEGSENDKARKNAFMFSFYSVREAMECCRVFENMEPFDSSFYYLSEDDVYFLILRRTEKTPDGFERRVLSANEFGELVTSNEQYISFVTEHGICIAKDNAMELFMNVMPGYMIPKVRRKSDESDSGQMQADGAAAPESGSAETK
ncbi:MAG: adaptor protein MecA [Lachnospiraceae bacterium]|nr:adaptor protein MecA [Lachnospiraceae bacterium]